MSSQYTVSQGDCISSIAASFGLPFDVIWNDPGNADLKKTRPDPNVLYEGDVVTVPDIRPRTENRGTDAQHKFKKKDPPTHIKIRFLRDDEPRAGLSYELQVSGQTLKGTTDAKGYVQQNIPPDADTGLLILTDGNHREIYSLAFGTLDPIDTDAGVQERLGALGFNIEGDLADAVRAFQAKQKMTVTGTVDDALRSKLKGVFGQ